jgi:phosphoribosylglycinamide formyltransferase-1
MQGAVPVLATDTPEALAERVLKLEHRIYPLALRLVANGAARVMDERVVVDGPRTDAGATLLSPPA